MRTKEGLKAKALRRRRRMFCKCCRKLKKNCVMKAKKGPKIVNKRSGHRLHADDKNVLMKLETEEQNMGSYGWAKIDGWPWWPAIVITSSSCGLPLPKDNYHYVFWLGHNTVSQARKSLFYDFKHKFDIFTKNIKQKHAKKLNSGIIEGIKYHATNIGYDTTEFTECELWEWANKGFPLDKMKKTEPVKKALPQNVVDVLKVIMDKNLKLKKKKFNVEVRELNKKKSAELSCVKAEEGNLCDEQQASVQQKTELQSSSGDEAEIFFEKPQVKPRTSKEQIANLRLLKENEIIPQLLCLSCFSKDEINERHPFLEGGLCSPCLARFKKFIFYSSDYSKKEICCICFYKGDKVRCQNDSCQGSVCKDCYKVFGILQIEEYCLVCSDTFDDSNLFIKRRIDKLTKVVSLFSDVFSSIDNKKSMSVITVFEEKLEGYYLMEPLKLPITFHVLADGSNMIDVWVKEGNRNTIRLKPPEKCDSSNLKNVVANKQIDLLVGGCLTYETPIQTSSRGPFKLKGFGEVFFRFIEFLYELKTLQQESHLFWLFFVSSTAPLHVRDFFTSHFCTEPVTIPGIPRVYWGNLPGLGHTVVHKNIITKFNIPAFSPLCYHIGEFGGWLHPERIYGFVPVKAGSFSAEERDPSIEVPDPAIWMGEIEYLMRGLRLIYN